MRRGCGKHQRHKHSSIRIHPSISVQAATWCAPLFPWTISKQGELARNTYLFTWTNERCMQIAGQPLMRVACCRCIWESRMFLTSEHFVSRASTSIGRRMAWEAPKWPKARESHLFDIYILDDNMYCHHIVAASAANLEWNTSQTGILNGSHFVTGARSSPTPIPLL